MVIQYLSDVHTEKHGDHGVQFCEWLDANGVDVLVIAGDFCDWITNYPSRQAFGVLAPKYPRILYVPGNHEYWDVDATEMSARFRNLEDEFPNVSVLDQWYTEIDGQRFYGGTMWYTEPSPLLALMKQKWPDYKYIKNFEPWVYQQNAAFKRMLQTNVQEGDVVISHHMPSYQSVAPRYKTDLSNHFYVTEMDEDILALKPALWIHGHTHNNFDYKIGDTRVVCNPYGYPHEATTRNAFKQKALITL